MRRIKRACVRVIPVLSVTAVLAGCVGAPPPATYREPEIVPVTQTQSALKELPPPTSRIPVAVYDFPDQTGQFKPQENVQTLSRAVSQGGAAILIKALRDAGRGQWFTTLERNGLDDLLKERQIIADMRLRYLGERQVNPQALPPLLFAGILLQGGIVGFDTNTLTGGLGARFLGIGGDVEYRQNTVTVNLRAVSVKTGEVLANVTTSKTLASVGVSGGAFKFVSFDKLLEVEAGVTNNEPGVMALRRTIEKAVYAMIMEGSETGLWAFQDASLGARLVAKYYAEEQGIVVESEGTGLADVGARTRISETPRRDAVDEGARRVPTSEVPLAAHSGSTAQPRRSERPVRRIAEAPIVVASAKPAEDNSDLTFNWVDGQPTPDRPKRTKRRARSVAAKASLATANRTTVLSEPHPGTAITAPSFKLRRNASQAMAQTSEPGLDSPQTAPGAPDLPETTLTAPDAPSVYHPPRPAGGDDFTGGLGA